MIRGDAAQERRSSGPMVAALYVERGGVYYGLPDVDPWDEERDARLYAGPWPVVAHPPCARWGAFATRFGAVLRKKGPAKIGDDGGCFEAALASVRAWGGVLEHPRGSRAWKWFGLKTPGNRGGWVVADWQGGWTCEVNQVRWGHPCYKPTWLYACGVAPPSLDWARGTPTHRFMKAPPGESRPIDHLPELRKSLRARTPIPFRDLLLSIARSVPQRQAATP